MKKLLTVLALVAFTGSVMAATTNTSTPLSSYLNSKVSKVTQKEQEVNAKIEAQKKADAAKKAELEKKQAEQKAAIEKAKKDAQARQDARKKAIESEKNYWKNLAK